MARYKKEGGTFFVISQNHEVKCRGDTFFNSKKMRPLLGNLSHLSFSALKANKQSINKYLRAMSILWRDFFKNRGIRGRSRPWKHLFLIMGVLSIATNVFAQGDQLTGKGLTPNYSSSACGTCGTYFDGSRITSLPNPPCAPFDVIYRAYANVKGNVKKPVRFVIDFDNGAATKELRYDPADEAGSDLVANVVTVGLLQYVSYEPKPTVPIAASFDEASPEIKCYYKPTMQIFVDGVLIEKINAPGTNVWFKDDKLNPITIGAVTGYETAVTVEGGKVYYNVCMGDEQVIENPFEDHSVWNCQEDQYPDEDFTGTTPPINNEKRLTYWEYGLDNGEAQGTFLAGVEVSNTRVGGFVAAVPNGVNYTVKSNGAFHGPLIPYPYPTVAPRRGADYKFIKIPATTAADEGKLFRLRLINQNACGFSEPAEAFIRIVSAPLPVVTESTICKPASNSVDISFTDNNPRHPRYDKITWTTTAADVVINNADRQNASIDISGVPNAEFNDDGIFTVPLEVAVEGGSSSCVNRDAGNITIYKRPDATFALDKHFVCARMGETVTVSYDLNKVLPLIAATKVTVDWGDGTVEDIYTGAAGPARVITKAHTYNTLTPDVVTEYPVKLTATNGLCQDVETSPVVVVYPTAPTITGGPTGPVCADPSVDLDFSCSAKHATVVYEWHIEKPDGTTDDLARTVNPDLTYTFDQNGEYRLTVDVISTRTACPTTSAVKTVVIDKPVVPDGVLVNKEICVDPISNKATAQVNLSLSSPTRAGTKYVVNWGGGEVETFIVNGAGNLTKGGVMVAWTVDHEYDYTGTGDAVQRKNIDVEVTSPVGACTKSKFFQVKINPLTEVAFTVPAVNCDGTPIAFVNNSKGVNKTYKWSIKEWDTGAAATTGAELVPLAERTKEIPNVTLPGNKEYQATLELSTACRPETTSHRFKVETVDVNLPAGVIELCTEAPGVGDVDADMAEYTLDLTAISPKSAGTTYRIDWGDGSAVLNKTQAQMVVDGWTLDHSYAYAGDGNTPKEYTLTVSVTSVANACQNIQTRTVRVHPKVDPNFMIPADAYCLNSGNVTFTNVSTGSGLSYVWTVRNVTTATDVTPVANNNRNLVFDFIAEGEYQITLAVSSANGCKTNTISKNLKVVDPAGAFTIKGHNGYYILDKAVTEKRDVVIDLTGSSYIEPGTEFEVDFGNGTTKTLNDTDLNGVDEYTFDNPGYTGLNSTKHQYPVELIVKKSGCNSVPITKNVIIYRVGADFTVDETNKCRGQYSFSDDSYIDADFKDPVADPAAEKTVVREWFVDVNDGGGFNSQGFGNTLGFNYPNYTGADITIHVKLQVKTKITRTIAGSDYEETYEKIKDIVIPPSPQFIPELLSYDKCPGDNQILKPVKPSSLKPDPNNVIVTVSGTGSGTGGVATDQDGVDLTPAQMTGLVTLQADGSYQFSSTLASGKTVRGEFTVRFNVRNNPGTAEECGYTKDYTINVSDLSVTTEKFFACNGVPFTFRPQTIGGNPAGRKHKWEMVSEPAPGSLNATTILDVDGNEEAFVFTPAASGDFKIRYTATDVAGCTASGVFTITVSDQPNTSATATQVGGNNLVEVVAGSEYRVCGTSVHLNGLHDGGAPTGTMHGKWSILNKPGGTVAPVLASTASLDVNGLQPGIYDFKFTVKNNVAGLVPGHDVPCDDHTLIKIHVYEPITVVVKPGLGTVVPEDGLAGPTTLHPEVKVTGGSGAYTYSWDVTKPGGVTDRNVSTDAIPNYSATIPGVYRFVAHVKDVVDDVCVADSPGLPMEVVDRLEANAGRDKAVCGTSTTMDAVLWGISAGGIGQGTWTQIAGPGTTNITSKNNIDSQVTVDAYGTYTYRWTVTNSKVGIVVTDFDDVNITYHAPVTIDFGSDDLYFNKGDVATMTPEVEKDGTVLTGAALTNDYDILWTDASGKLNDTAIEKPAFNTGTTGDFDLKLKLTQRAGVCIPVEKEVHVHILEVPEAAAEIPAATTTIGDAIQENIGHTAGSPKYIVVGKSVDIRGFNKVLGGTQPDDDPADHISGVWTVNKATASFDHADRHNPKVSVTDFGTYTLTYTINSGMTPATNRAPQISMEVTFVEAVNVDADPETTRCPSDGEVEIGDGFTVTGGSAAITNYAYTITKDGDAADFSALLKDDAANDKNVRFDFANASEGTYNVTLTVKDPYRELSSDNATRVFHVTKAMLPQVQVTKATVVAVPENYGTPGVIQKAQAFDPANPEYFIIGKNIEMVGSDNGAIPVGDVSGKWQRFDGGRWNNEPVGPTFTYTSPTYGQVLTKWVLSNITCDQNLRVVLNFVEPIVIDPINDFYFCRGDNNQALNALVKVAGGSADGITYEWKVIKDADASDVTATVLTASDIRAPQIRTDNTVEEGNYTVTLKATDKHGSIQSQTVTFKIHILENPIAGIQIPDAAAWGTPGATVQYKAGTDGTSANLQVITSDNNINLLGENKSVIGTDPDIAGDLLIGEWVMVAGPDIDAGIVPWKSNVKASNVTIVNAGVYTFKWSVYNETPAGIKLCEDVKTVKVEFVAGSNARPEGDQQVCQEAGVLLPLQDLVELTGGSGTFSEYRWTAKRRDFDDDPLSETDANTQIVDGNITDKNASLKLDNDGLYYITLTATDGRGIGGTSATFKVAIIPHQTSNAGVDQQTCGDEVTLAANAINPINGLGRVGKWTVNPVRAVTFDDVNDPNTKIYRKPGTSGNFTLTWTITSSYGGHDCPESSSVKVFFVQPIQIGDDLTGFVGNAKVCTGNDLAIQPVISGGSKETSGDYDAYTYQWTMKVGSAFDITNRLKNPIGGAPATNLRNLTLETGNIPPGVYTLTLNVSDPISGTCTATKDFTIEVKETPVAKAEVNTVGGTVKKLAANRYFTCLKEVDLLGSNSGKVFNNAGLEVNGSAVGFAGIQGEWSKVAGPGTVTFTATTVGAPTGEADPAAHAEFSKAGTYELQWLVYNADKAVCPSTTMITIEVKEPISVTFAPSPIYICQGDGVFTINPVYAGGSGIGYQNFVWTEKGTPVVGANTDSYQFDPTGKAPGVYAVGVTLNDREGNVCQGGGSVDVIIVRKPTPAIDKTTTEFCGLRGQLTAGALLPGEIGTWQLKPGPGSDGTITAIPNPHNNTTEFVVSNKGHYIFQWIVSNIATDGGGMEAHRCTTVDEIEVDMRETPVVTIDPPTNPECDKDADLEVKVVGDYLNLTWSLVRGPVGATANFNDEHSKTPTVTVSDYGVYVFKATVENGACAPQEKEVQFEFLSQPHASFDITSNLEGCSPIQVTVNNTTTGDEAINTYQYQWRAIDAADATDITVLSHEQDPAAGFVIRNMSNRVKDQNIILKVTNKFCVSEFTAPNPVKVHPMPLVDFDYTSDGGCSPVEATIQNHTQYADRYSWDFDEDGAEDSNIENPVHTYTNADFTKFNFKMKLTAYKTTGGFECSNSSERIIAVAPKPTFDLSSNASADGDCSPKEITFTATPGAIKYKWNFGDRSPEESKDYISAIDHLFEHMETTKQTYNVRVDAIFPGGCTATETVPVEIHPEMKADFDADKTTVCSGETVTFTNRSTPGATSYVWNINGFEVTQNTFEPVFTYTFNSASFGQVPMNVTLTVKTDKCTDKANQIITVNPLAKAGFDFAAGKDKFCSGDQVVFSNTTVGGKTFVWDYGDGSATDDLGYHTFTNTNAADVVHTVKLTANNDFGCSSNVTKDVTIIHEMIPAWSFNVKKGCSPLTVEITNNTTGGEDATIDFGDKSPKETVAAGTTVTHVYTNDAVSEALFNVTMDVAANGDGDCSKQLHEVVRVNPVIHADFSFAEDKVTYCSGDLAILENNTVGVTDYKWTYGDGTEGKNSVHTYENKTLADVKRTVRLDVENFFHCTDFVEKEITVIHDAEPKMKVVVDGECSPVVATLTNLTVGANTMSIDWGDGSPAQDVSAMAAGETVEHTFTNDEVYIKNFNIVLTASPGGGCSKHTDHKINVKPSVTADFDLSAGGCSPIVASVTNNSTGALRYDWDFGVPTDPDATSVMESPKYQYVNTTNDIQTFTVTMTATSSFGCRATAAPKTIDIKPQPTVTFDVDHREGCAPFIANFTNTSKGVDNFTWDIDAGETITETKDDYKVKFSHTYNNRDAYERGFTVRLLGENRFGCSDEQTMEMNIKPEVTAEFDMAMGEVCSPVNVAFSTAGSRGARYFSWEFGDKEVSNSANPNHEFTNDTDSPVTYEVILTTSSGECTSTAKKSLTIQPHMEANFSLDKITGCSPMELNIKNTSQNCSDYLWSFDGGATTETILDTEFSRTFTYAGRAGFPDPRNVSLTASNAYCRSKKTVEFRIFAPAVPGFSLNGDGNCSPARVNFISTTDHTYNVSWEFGDGSISDLANPEHIFLNETDADREFTITQTVTTREGCEASTTDKYLVHPTPNVDFNIHPIFMIWPEATVSVDNLTNEGPWTYKWSFGEYEDVTVDEKDPDPYTYGRVGSFVIQLEAKGNECASSHQETVTIRPGVPEASFKPSVAEGCGPLAVTFTNTSKNGATYYWEFGDGTFSTSKDPDHTFHEEGYYNVKLTVRNEEGTKDVAEQAIHVFPVPRAMFTVLPSRVEIPGQKAIFSNLSKNNYENYWDFGDKTTSTDVDPEHEYVVQGIHDVSLKVVSEDGCESSYTLPAAVTAVSNGRVKVPNAFVPSTNGPSGGSYDKGDTYNRVFYPVVPEGEAKVSSYDMKIYNRWGNIVFHTKDINIGWDGYYRGKLAPLGVYVWRIEVSFDDGNTIIQTGDVTLIR
ncbi:MAG: PKD domain-containing protein [Prolixibacteraceae bacterium]|nr:PKD domain-containing protein [Prolixibacteraceae bacterium]